MNKSDHPSEHFNVLMLENHDHTLLSFEGLVETVGYTFRGFATGWVLP